MSRYLRYLPLFLISVFIYVIYAKTMLPSQGYHDIGDLQTAVATLNIPHPTGFPLYIILGKAFVSLFPFGEVAWRVNLLSVLYSVAALIFASLFLFKLSRDYIFSLSGILILAFCKPFWNNAGFADTHTLSRTFLFILIYIFYLLYDKWSGKLLFIFALALGLGISDHLLLLYSLPGFSAGFIFLLFKSKKKKLFIYSLPWGISGLLFGLIPYIFLPIRSYLGNVNSIDYSLTNFRGFERYVLGEDFQGLMYQGGTGKIIENMLNGILEMNKLIGPIAIFLGIVGALYLIKKSVPLFTMLSIMFFCFLLVSTNYPTSDPSRYYLTFVSIFTLFISMGAVFLKEMFHIIFKQKYSYASLTLFFLLTVLSVRLFLSNYKLVDHSFDYSAKTYSEDVMKEVEPNSIVLSWWNYSTPLWYSQQVLNQRKDIIIINTGQTDWSNIIYANIRRRPVYTVEKLVDTNLTFTGVGDIYKVSLKDNPVELINPQNPPQINNN